MRYGLESDVRRNAIVVRMLSLELYPSCFVFLFRSVTVCSIFGTVVGSRMWVCVSVKVVFVLSM